MAATIIQMTTPLLELKVDVDLREASECSVAFKQGMRNRLVLDIDSLDITATKISHRFTQEETALFSSEAPISVQIKAMLGDLVYANNVKKNPILIDVSEIFDKRKFGVVNDG